MNALAMASDKLAHVSLSSFGVGFNVAVLGASGGIGRAFVDALLPDPSVSAVLTASRRSMPAANGKLAWVPLDLEDEESIETAASAAADLPGPLSMVIVATGMLHDAGNVQPEKTWRSIKSSSLEKAFKINAIGPALVAKHFLPLLARDRKSVFAALSARVGSIGDNELGGWYAYRASKAALNMMIKTLSIELARRNPNAICVGLHPGTVDTELSAPFQGAARRLFTPDQAARCLLNVVDGLTAKESGAVLAWDGTPIVP
jgi:NAD(P)-dependent dehydrogenase (short-subunit alcohol dehydrogenase family)